MASTNGLPVPTLTSSNNPPADLLTLANGVDSLYGLNVATWSALPTSSNFVGREVFVADSHMTAVWNGSAWVSSGVPVGALTQFAGSAAPAGYLLCQGQSVSTSTYPRLFAVIGYQYGGTGSSFTVPNLKGRIPVGLDSAQTEFDVLGETGGAKTHTLSSSEMPTHSHGVTDPGHAHTINDPRHQHWGTNSPYDGAGNNAAPGNQNLGNTPGNYSSGLAYTGITINSSGTGISIGNAGSGTAHNNLQPYISLNYIIKH